MIFAIVAETASPGMGNPILAGVWRPAHTYNLPFQVLSCFCTRVGVAIRYATCQNSLLLAKHATTGSVSSMLLAIRVPDLSTLTVCYAVESHDSLKIKLGYSSKNFTCSAACRPSAFQRR